jgi:hypothetical protein
MNYDFKKLLNYAHNNPLEQPDWRTRPWGRPVLTTPTGDDPELVATATIRYNGIFIDGIKIYYRNNALEIISPSKFVDQYEQTLFSSDIIWVYRNHIKTK